MNIKISDHFSSKKLIKFVSPAIIMMIFTSIYGVVDGLFVSNFAGKTAFAAVNLIMPYLMGLGVVGFMVGTGGNALVSKTLGEGKTKKANEIFSLLVYFVIAFGIVLTIVGELTIPKIALMLGADEEMLKYCVLYARINILSLTFFMLQNVFQSLFATAGKPQLGLFITIFAGISNMILDFLFVGVLKYGVAGAAVATVTAETIGGFVPLLYFAFNKKGSLKLGKTHFDFKAILKTCTNGASELMTNISMSLVNMFYNYQLMKFFGSDGVAAYGVIMYINFVFVSAFLGYSIGVAPIVGYNFGSGNQKELKNIFKKSLTIIGIFSVVLVVLSIALSGAIGKIFVGYDEGLQKLTVTAFRLFATSYLLVGFNIFSSAFFTALNNGGVSATISFLRTLLFQIVSIFLLPMLFGQNAIWISITVAEFLALIVSAYFLISRNKKYKYI